MLVDIGTFAAASCPSTGLNVFGDNSVTMCMSYVDGGGGITSRSPGSYDGITLSLKLLLAPGSTRFEDIICKIISRRRGSRKWMRCIAPNGSFETERK